MKLTLLKIEDRGLGLCAVFAYTEITGQPPFALNAENLAIRIRNLEAQSIDASVERDALAQIKRMEQGK
jgi:hypothetical protein